MWFTKTCLVRLSSALEGAESTLLMASGMCASTIMLMALIPAGGHMVTTTDCYRKTRIFIETILPKMGIKVSLFLARQLCYYCMLGICNSENWLTFNGSLAILVNTLRVHIKYHVKGVISVSYRK